MSDDPADYEPDVIVHAEPIAFRPQSFELAVPRTRTRHTIPIPRETMRELVFPVGTPAAGVHVERDTAEFDRAELAQLVEATRPPAHEHAIAARMAMTADVAAPAALEIVSAIVRAKRELGLTRAEVTAALGDAGMHRLSFMHVGKGTEIFGAQPGSGIPLVAIPVENHVPHLLVRVNCEWIAYRVRSARDVAMLAREVRRG